MTFGRSAGSGRARVATAEAKNKNSSLQTTVIDKIQTPLLAESCDPTVGFSAADKIPSWKYRRSYPNGADDPAKTPDVSAKHPPEPAEQSALS
jgi:hypothetical protein